MLVHHGSSGRSAGPGPDDTASARYIGLTERAEKKQAAGRGAARARSKRWVRAAATALRHRSAW